MCGIAGVIYFDGKSPAPEPLQVMIGRLHHRGPDDRGVVVQGPVGLANARLAILDLSPRGHQPMANEDRTVWVVHNGEIYNFRELRRELETQGHVFRSHTDTEVVVHAYEEWGIDCVQHFNGMFATAIWDGRQQNLWLVRDRLGIKPLFYAHLKDRFLFASEIKAILADSGVPRELDPRALAYYLALNYTPAPYTLFRSVRQVLPGQYVKVTAHGEVQSQIYWDLDFGVTEDRPFPAWRDDFLELLSDAVRLRLVSDVPFGVFLSGGLDSSTVAYWMTRHLREPVTTFSVGFGEPTYDEIVYARNVAHALGTEHHEQIIRPDAATVVPKLVWHAEEPTADSSMIGVYFLAAHAREHVKMVLTGDGGDELLAGYPTYTAYYLYRIYLFLPRWLRRRVFQPLAGRVPASDARISWDFQLKRFVGSEAETPEDAHATWRMVFNTHERQRLLAPVWQDPEVRANVVDLYREMFDRSPAHQPLSRMLYVDTRFYLPNDMLVKVDRMTMAHGLEARVPFLDHRLVEFMARVPPKYKLRWGLVKKYLLKRAMQGRLPRSVLHRGKQGFNLPVPRWIKGDLREFVMDHLAPERLSSMGIFDVAYVQRLLDDHFHGRRDNSFHIWGLLTLSLWWQTFYEKNYQLSMSNDPNNYKF